MELLEVKKSQLDKTVKHIYDWQGHKVEYVYIDNNTGKDIICVPSQTGCKLGCDFCHLTYRNDKQVKHIDPATAVAVIIEMIQLYGNPDNKDLLISFMGAGEPLLDSEYISDVMVRINNVNMYTRNLRSLWAYKVRAGVASLIPSADLFREFAVMAHRTGSEYGVPIKFHWSLHHTTDEARKKDMPAALPIKESLELIKMYQTLTGNPVEIHYTVHQGNCSGLDAFALARLAEQEDLPIKFLQYRPRPDREKLEEEMFARWMGNIKSLRECYVFEYETYTPPGSDILSGCGQFEPV